MAAISVRDLDDVVANLLKVRASRHGRSMEAEVWAILTAAIEDEKVHQLNLARAVHDRLAPLCDGANWRCRSDRTSRAPLS